MRTLSGTLRFGVSGSDALLMLLAGVLGGLAFPPVGWYPAIVAAYGILYWRIHAYPAERARNAALLFGLAYGTSTMHWLFGLFGFAAISLIGVFAFYHGLLGHLLATTRTLPVLLRALAVAGFAVGIEWWRGEGPWLPFAWYTIPHALAQSPAWIASVRWLGTYGLSFAATFILLLGVCGRRRWLLLTGLLPLCALVLPQPGAPDRHALLVQTEDGGAQAQVRQLPALSADLVVFPELAWIQSPASLRQIADGPAAVARRYAAAVVAGAVEGRYGSSDFQNVAAVFDRHGGLLGAFPKQHPVPLMLDGRPGQTRPVFPVADGVLGVAICYDADAPDVAADLTRAGATLLVIPTYDAMHWGVLQHMHHGLLARLRAVENGRWLLRAVSSGRSEAIDPHGYPSAAGVAIGDAGWVRVGYRHERAQAMGSRMAALGPLCGALTGWYLLALLVTGCRRRGVAS